MVFRSTFLLFFSLQKTVYILLIICKKNENPSFWIVTFSKGLWFGSASKLLNGFLSLCKWFSVAYFEEQALTFFGKYKGCSTDIAESRCVLSWDRSVFSKHYLKKRCFLPYILPMIYHHDKNNLTPISLVVWIILTLIILKFS